MKNKLFLIIAAILIIITLILGAAVLLWTMMDKKNTAVDPGKAAAQSVESVKPKKLTAAQIKDLTVEVKDILTNLSDKDRVVKASFAFELDNKKARDEFTELDFKVRNIIIQTLSDMTTDQIKGSKGQDDLKAALINKINQNVLTQGKLTEVSITDIIVQ